MKFRKSLAIVLSGVAVLASAAYGQQQYHSNDVTPPSAAANPGYGVLTGARLAGAGKGKQVGGAATTAGMHAHVLHGNALTATDLNPLGYNYSFATSSDDFSECGYGGSVGGIRGLLWSGSAASVVALQPPSGFADSFCTGVDNGREVGFSENLIYSFTNSHALYWNNSPTPVDLHPAGGLPYSRAIGVKGGEQVGYMSSIAYPYFDVVQAYHITSHAYRWAGTAASGVDLHPALFDASEAAATNGTQQGGWGYTVLGTSHLHALLWSGTAASAVDLSPAAFTDTQINALNVTQQVGEGWAGTVRHALLWSGTADSVTDLNQYLPPGYTQAVATGIDIDGNVVGYAYNGVFGPGSSAWLPPGAIAVVFAPNQAGSYALQSISLAPANVRPGALVQGTVTLAGPAPASGAAVTFFSTDQTMAATPASLTIAEGQTSGTFTVPALGAALTVPTALRLYASDGFVSQSQALTITPIVRLTAITGSIVEGGFTSYGTLSLNIPAQAGGAVVSLTSGNPALVNVPASVTVFQGYSSTGYNIATVPVTVATTVPVTASWNGDSFTAQVTLSPAPVVSVSSLSVSPVVGGQSFSGYVSMNNFPRGAEGATITLTSSDSSVKVPATVLVAKGFFSVGFAGTTSITGSVKNVSITASYNGSSVVSILQVNPIPLVTILTAEYNTSTKIFKVTANTSYANSILTYGTDPKLGPLGNMQLDLGVWSGATILATAPTQATVWNSNGGQATIPVVVKTTATGGGGGGGGSSTSTTFKLTIVTAGKGSVATTCAGGAACASPYASGTSVTLTATPAAGSPWTGWSGACSGTATSCTVVMTKDTSVTATFK